MAKSEASTVRTFLRGLFDKDKLREVCRRERFEQRKSKVIPVELLLSIILHVAPNLQRMMDKFVLGSGTIIARSSFYQRMGSSGLERVVRTMVTQLEQRARGRRLPRRSVRATKPFIDVIALDSTVLVLPKGLELLYRGTRKQYLAAAKVFTAIRVTTGELLHHKLAPERTAEVDMFKGMPIQNNRLYLLDMGFSATWLWRKFSHANAYFLSRLNSNFKPTICSGPFQGWHLRDVIKRRDMKRNAEFQCRFFIRSRPHGVKTGELIQLRVVALYDHDKKKHWLYVTNTSRRELSRKQVRKHYALRWQIELSYKLGKGELGLSNITSNCPATIRTLIGASLIRCCCAMQAKRIADAHLPKGRWINIIRWAIVWAQLLPIILAAHSTDMAFSQIALIAADPNRKRRPSRFLAFPQLMENTV
jgi:hypothetical protein